MSRLITSISDNTEINSHRLVSSKEGIRTVQVVMAEYKLTYFDFRIYGELPRWVLSAAGQPFSDVRLSYGSTEWKTLKPETPFGKLPILETEGQMLCQSQAIARFLAKRFGMAGRTDLEQAKVDMVADCVKDMMTPLGRYIWYCRTQDEMDAEGRHWHEVKDGFFTKFENLLKSNNGGDGYFVGDTITWSDMAVVIGLTYAEGFEPDRYPKLAAHGSRVQSHPGIAAWIKARPEGDYEKSLYAN